MEITSQTAHSFQLSEFRDHCRVPWTDDDPALQRSLDGAVSLWERFTNWFLRATVVEIAITPGMIVPFGPSPALSTVTEYRWGVSEGLVSTEWYLKNVWGSRSFRLTDTGTWSPDYEYIASVTVAGEVSPAAKVAVFDLGNHLFTDREGTVTGVAISEVPLSLRTLIQNHQLGGL